MLYNLRVGIMDTNCYIFADDKTKETMVIDPGEDADEILKTIKENDLNVKFIILTHGHWDHIGALGELKKQTGALVLIHTMDAESLKDSNMNLSCLFGVDKNTVSADRLLNDGDEITLGESKVQVIHTPGHTLGGICLKIGNILFSGDTLFNGTIGRTDLYGGDYNTLINSIKMKLFTLDEEVEVYPGHGMKTTIGKEKNSFRM